MVDVVVRMSQSPGVPFKRLAQEKIAAKAFRQACSDVLRKYSTRIKRNIASELQVPQKIIGPRIKLSLPKTSDLGGGVFKAKIWIGTYRIAVVRTLRTGSHIRMGARGVVVGSKTKDKLSLERGSFLAKMQSGKEMIATRLPGAATATGVDSKGRQRKHRLPLDELMLRMRDMAERQLQEQVSSDEFIRAVSATFERKIQQYLNTQ